MECRFRVKSSENGHCDPAVIKNAGQEDLLSTLILSLPE
jgi:hypothetical protein